MKLNDIHDYVKIMDNELNQIINRKQKKMVKELGKKIELFGLNNVIRELNISDQLKRKGKDLYISPNIESIARQHQKDNFSLVKDYFAYGEDIMIEPFIYWNGMDFLRFKFTPEEMNIQYKNILGGDSIVCQFKDESIISQYNLLHDWAADYIHKNIINPILPF